jgi:5'(3')-deoxyribonucleotidase
MIIAIDFDCTLFPTLEKVIEIYNKRYNDNISVEQINTYDLYESLDKDVADKIIDIFCDQEVYDNLQPYEYAVDVIKKLIVHGHEIFIATATCAANLCWKEKLLQKHFSFIPKNNLIRIYQKNLLNVDVIIDDCLDNLINSDAKKICFDHSWNRNKKIDSKYNIYRAYSWIELLNIIERKDK